MPPSISPPHGPGDRLGGGPSQPVARGVGERQGLSRGSKLDLWVHMKPESYEARVLMPETLSMVSKTQSSVRHESSLAFSIVSTPGQLHDLALSLATDQLVLRYPLCTPATDRTEANERRKPVHFVLVCSRGTPCNWYALPLSPHRIAGRLEVGQVSGRPFGSSAPSDEDRAGTPPIEEEDKLTSLLGSRAEVGDDCGERLGRLLRGHLGAVLVE